MSVTTEPAGIAPESPDTTGEPVARLVHPRAIRWMHWINFPVMLVMVWSGLRIYWAHDVYAIGIGSWQWFAFFPEVFYQKLDLTRHLGRGIAFHFTFAWFFVINGLIYAIYLAVTREWRHIVPDRKSVREAAHVVLHDMRIKKTPPPQGKYNAAQRISYTIVLIMAAVLVVSGFAIYKPSQLYPLPLLFGGYQGARKVHFAMTIGISLFFFIHVVQVARSGWNNFRGMVTGYAIEQPSSNMATATGNEATADDGDTA